VCRSRRLGVYVAYRDKKVVGVFVCRFRAPLQLSILDESKLSLHPYTSEKMVGLLDRHPWSYKTRQEKFTAINF
jgi:hypothetical protein